MILNKVYHLVIIDARRNYTDDIRIFNNDRKVTKRYRNYKTILNSSLNIKNFKCGSDDSVFEIMMGWWQFFFPNIFKLS